MACHFLDLPSEIRILIYKLLLADSCVVVQYLFVRHYFRSMFRNKTPPGLSAQILVTCQQIAREGAPILYGFPQFDCSNCILGIEKLQAQIGLLNFNLIKRMILDTEDLHSIAGALQGRFSSDMYRNLKSLTTKAHRIVDLSQPGWEFELKVQAMAKLCLSAQHILQSGSQLRVLGQNSRKENNRSVGDAIDASNHRVRWKFARSQADLTPDDHLLDVKRLLDLALLMQGRSGEIISEMGRQAPPVPLAHGIQQILYP